LHKPAKGASPLRSPSVKGLPLKNPIIKVYFNKDFLHKPAKGRSPLRTPNSKFILKKLFCTNQQKGKAP
jgi:hypothetical protein